MKNLLILILLSLAFTINADVFASNEAVKEIKTEHFTFIFPESISEVAIELAGKAEDIYTYVADLLEQPKNLSLPVVLTPDSDALNGYFTISPYSRLVLYVSPMLPNSGWLKTGDTLESLFLHELVHAISLNSRTDINNFLRLLVGDVYAPAAWSAPSYFVEGVTVSFESLQGYGRTNSPRHAATLQQAIIEGKFPSYQEATGVAGGVTSGRYYEYGGFFSKYLQETYGFPKYAELWKEMGRGDLPNDFFFMEGAFKRVYKISLEQAWSDFKHWIMIKKPVVSSGIQITAPGTSFSALTMQNNQLYYGQQDGIYTYTPDTKIAQKLVDFNYPVTRLEVSDDNNMLLISTYEYIEYTFPKAKTVLYNMDSQQYTDIDEGLSLYEAEWANGKNNADGIIAIEKNNYTGNLILLNNGKKTVLLEGNTNQIPSRPVMTKDGILYFVLKHQAFNKIARIRDIDAPSIEILEPETIVDNIQYISESDTGLLFTYANDLSMTKLAVLDNEALSLQNTVISGGIHFPIGNSIDELYYKGLFTDGQALMGYPTDRSYIEFDTLSYNWTPFTQEVGNPVSDASFEITSYNPLPWALVPGIRMPIWEMDFVNFQVSSFGVLLISGDPTEQFLLTSQLLYNFKNSFLNADLNLQITNWDPVIGIQFRDMLVETASDITRYSILRTEINKSFDIWPTDSNIWTSLGLSGILRSTGIENPYSWEQEMLSSYYADIGYSDVFVSADEKNMRYGWQIHTGYQGYTDFSDMTVFKGIQEAKLQIFLPFLNFEAMAYGAYSYDASLTIGPQGVLQNNNLQAFIYTPGYNEYRDITEAHEWYFAGDFNIGYEFETDQPFVLGMFVESIDFKTGYRNALIDKTYLDSLYFDITADVRFTEYGILDRISVDVGLEVVYALRKPADQALTATLLTRLPF